MSGLWMVLEVDHDCCGHLAAFTTEDEAERFAAHYRSRQDEFGGDVVIEEIRPTTDWRQAPGAWEVCIDPAGEIVGSRGVTYTSADHERWGEHHAHWWVDGPADDGSVIRAVGWDEAEAHARALALLAEGAAHWEVDDSPVDIEVRYD